MIAAERARSVVEASFPEAELIRDRELAERVIAVWAMAWPTSAWGRLTDCPKGIVLPHVSLVSHSRAVTRMALAMADIVEEIHGISVDRDAVAAIGLLHDVSRLHEYEPGPDGACAESELGRRYQHGFLAGVWMVNAGFRPEIVHGVIAHTPESATPLQTIEAVLVHYADFADTDAARLHHSLTAWAKQRSA